MSEASAALLDARGILARMPKAELHLHLEGTVRPETLWELARQGGTRLPAASLEELRARYRFQDFGQFLDLWQAMHASFRDASAYERMVDDFLAACRQQRIRYAEVHFTPFNHERFGGLGGRRAVEVVARRLEQAEAAGGPVARLILDIPTDALPESGEYTAALLESLVEPLVVAIGLGGPEVGFPRFLAAPYFARARRRGYHAVAHAGETFGAEHVRQAVLDLKVRRVQHGVQAAEDPEVLRLLAAADVCCDIALTSNGFLTPFRDLATHPLRRLLAAGVPATLSTDDPAFFGCDLSGEYERAHGEAGLSLAELWELNLNGLRYGLGEVALRRRLLEEFLAEGRRLGLETG